MKKYNLEKIKEKLERCKDMPLSEVSLDDVDEISDIKIDRRKPSNEKNPYVFKVKGRLVKMRFSDTDLTAEDCLTNVLKNLYK